jgi:hypothetical protein
MNDSHIPVLTEVISKAQEEKSNHDVSEQALAQLAQTLHENVLRQLLTRIDFVLEHRIRDGLAEVLQTATDDLAKEIRQGLNHSLEELIHRTINQEISKVQSLKAKQVD